MDFRLRAVKGLAVLLYIGPLFAGLGGLGPGMIAPFVGFFLVWLIVLRPEQWPATSAEWLTLSAWGSVLTQVLSQVLLVCVLLAIGRGMGAMVDFSPVIGPFFPLAISFLAIPLCRSLWDSGHAASSGVFLDAEAEAAHAPRAVAQAAAAVVPLLNLPDDMVDSLTTDAVEQVMRPPGTHLRLKALAAALSRPNRSHAALRRALVLWVTEPDIVASGEVPGGMAAAFEIAGRDADLLRLYLPRALALIAAFPESAPDFPNSRQLVNLALLELFGDPDHDLPSDLRADLHDGLLALADALGNARSDEPAANPDVGTEVLSAG